MQDETRKGVQDTLLGKGQSSGAGEGSTSNLKSPKTYTEQEYQAAVEKTRSDALAEAGRKYKPIEYENTTLKSQLATNQTLIKDNADKAARLEAQIEDLSKDDPDRQRYVKKLKELEEQEQKLKADRQALEADNNEVKLYKRNKMIEEVVKGYDGLEAARLTTLCDRFNLTSKEQIEMAAESIGTRKAPPAEPTKPAVKADSGLTNWGGVDTSRMTAHEKIIYGMGQAGRR